jgi:3-dehydroquinate synthetase
VFNVLFVGYSLAKYNLNSTYQYNMIPKKNSKTMNYLKFKVSRTLQTIIVTGIGKKYTRDAERKNLLRVYNKN